MLKSPGCLVAPLTPFTAEGAVDYARLESHIDLVISRAAPAALIVAGVEVQEYQYLSMSGREELITRTLEFIDGRVPTIVGVSHPSWRTSVELAHLAEDKGASLIQVLAPQRPISGPPSTEELIAYYESIGGESSLDIVLYLNPGPGANVSDNDTIALASLEKVVAIKESSRDFSRILRLMAEIQHAGKANYFTTMQVLLPSLMVGGAGATMPPPAAFIAKGIVDAFVDGDLKRAGELQLKVATYPKKWMRHGLAPLMKVGMEFLGEGVGDAYPPYGKIPPGDRRDIFETLELLDIK